MSGGSSWNDRDYLLVGLRDPTKNGTSSPQGRVARELCDAASQIIDRIELRLAQIRGDGSNSFDTTISECEQVLSEIRGHIGELDNPQL